MMIGQQMFNSQYWNPRDIMIIVYTGKRWCTTMAFYVLMSNLAANSTHLSLARAIRLPGNLDKMICMRNFVIKSIKTLDLSLCHAILSTQGCIPSLKKKSYAKEAGRCIWIDEHWTAGDIIFELLNEKDRALKVEECTGSWMNEQYWTLSVEEHTTSAINLLNRIQKTFGVQGKRACSPPISRHIFLLFLGRWIFRGIRARISCK